MSIQLEDVTYTYSPGTAYEMNALDHVSLEIPQGQFVGIIGHTGSGKSTLIQHFNGLMQPTSGRVLYNGEDIWQEGYSLRGLRFHVGLVFQYPEHQLFETTVMADVCFGPKNQGLDPEECRERAREALSQVEIPEELYEKSPFDLSGGQKRRVAIAGVLAMNPQILVLDEASAMLDPRGRAGLLRVCQELHERGMTIVMITHFMEEAALADRVVVLDGGRVRLDGTPEEVLTQGELLESLNLDMPFACRLSLQLQRRGVPVKACVTDAELEEELCRLFSTR